MVEPTQDRSDSDPTVAGRRLRNRCPQAEAAVRPIVVVAVDKPGQDPAEMTLAEGNQMVEALLADCPDPPFRNRVRAERLDRCPQALDSQPGTAPAEVGAPDPITVVDQKSSVGSSEN